MKSLKMDKQSEPEYLQSNGVRTSEYVQSGMEKSVQQPDVNSDDDFYSSKVSRKTLRDKLKGGKGLRSTIPRLKSWNSGKLSTLQIAFISSFASAIAACVIFGLIFGFGGSRVPYIDPSDRAVHATDKVRPAVVSIINEQKYSLELKGTPLEEGSEESGIYRQSGVGSGVIVKKDDGKASFFRKLESCGHYEPKPKNN